MMDKETTYTKAIDTYGKKAQIIVACEEMSELTKELCKTFRGRTNIDNIAEEIADVRIMLEQLELIFGCREKAKAYEAFKVERLANRLEREGL